MPRDQKHANSTPSSPRAGAPRRAATRGGSHPVLHNAAAKAFPRSVSGRLGGEPTARAKHASLGHQGGISLGCPSAANHDRGGDRCPPKFRAPLITFDNPLRGAQVGGGADPARVGARGFRLSPQPPINGGCKGLAHLCPLALVRGLLRVQVAVGAHPLLRGAGPTPRVARGHNSGTDATLHRLPRCEPNPHEPCATPARRGAARRRGGSTPHCATQTAVTRSG